MSALLVTALAFIPVILLVLSYIRANVLTKYLDDPNTKRQHF